MTITLLKPAMVQIGDLVTIDGKKWLVHAIEGPDSIGTFDFYFMRGDEKIHRIITEQDTLSA